MCRVEALFKQGRALDHAEAVLLVDDREPKLVKRDAVLYERVRAHDNVACPGRERLDDTARPGGRSRERGHADAQRPEHFAQGERVLFRKDFRRGHHGGLKAAVRGGGNSVQGYGHLAAPDVALQQPHHGPVRCHVPENFRDGALLRACQRKRERCAQGLKRRSVHHVAIGLGFVVPRQPREQHAKLNAQEFLVGKPVSS